MKIVVFSTKRYDRRFLEAANQRHGHELVFLEARLNADTVPLAQASEAVCVFVNDSLDAGVIARLAEQRTKLIALRCSGFNNVDLAAAAEHGIRVCRVPAYSPHAVAEHTVALLLTLNRQIHRAYNRVRESNFAIEGLLGFDLHGKMAGVIGTGRIGAIFCQLLRGFGCEVLAHDLQSNPDCIQLGVQYLELSEVHRQADTLERHGLCRRRVESRERSERHLSRRR